ncbi:MAG: prenyltransferase [Thermoplasmatota archaeon]
MPEDAPVRAILVRQLDPGGDPGSGWDPNRLVPAAELALRLAPLGDAGCREAGRRYMALWGRTFGTLTGHLRARPERAMNLFAAEVYPYLRGERGAAALHGTSPGHLRIELRGGLPPAYLCGLMEGMVALTGCRADAIHEGDGSYAVAYRVPAVMRLARAVQAVATLRIPLLLAAFLASLVGIAAAVATAPVAWWRVALASLAVLAVQGAANAWHDATTPAAGPLSPWRPSRSWLRAQMAAGYLFAGAAGWVFASHDPTVLLFVPLGLAASLLYHWARDRGWGPALVAVTHGPLVAVGVLFALLPHPSQTAVAGAVLASAPVGALAAAVRILDDLADRPLDEAGGRRTLAVRLPGRGSAILYALLVGFSLVLMALAWTAFHPSWRDGVLAAGALLGAACATLLARRIMARLDDPSALAALRAGTLALHVAVAAGSAALLGGLA